MNEVRHPASEWVQRGVLKVVCMISEGRHPAGEPRDPKGQEETTMLKTISAALLAVSFIAAPALAATSGKSATAPAVKTTQAPVIKAEQSKSKMLNANARMGRHTKHVRHHRSHKHMAV